MNANGDLPMSFTAESDAVVVASVSSSVESDLVDQWLIEQRRAHPGVEVDVVKLPLHLLLAVVGQCRGNGCPARVAAYVPVRRARCGSSHP
jgi:hypothetical protein